MSKGAPLPAPHTAELATRAKVRKRGVSLQTIRDEGTRANGTLMTIFQTAKKLNISVQITYDVYDYVFNRLSNKFEISSLAKLIRE